MSTRLPKNSKHPKKHIRPPLNAQELNRSTQSTHFKTLAPHLAETPQTATLNPGPHFSSDTTKGPNKHTQQTNGWTLAKKRGVREGCASCRPRYGLFTTVGQLRLARRDFITDVKRIWSYIRVFSSDFVHFPGHNYVPGAIKLCVARLWRDYSANRAFVAGYAWKIALLLSI